MARRCAACRLVVALKLLPSHFSSNDDRLRRFEQEARAASALNHPEHRLTIYEFGEIDSRNFMATEFIEGETLRQRSTLRIAQALNDNHTARAKLREALDVAEQVASALVTAHEAGIIHRDIKPDNIITVLMLCEST